MQYDHLKFYDHCSSYPPANASQPSSESTNLGHDLPTVDIHAAIVDYLKHLPASSWATHVDIQRDLHVSLLEDVSLLEMVKRNPWIEREQERSGSIDGNDGLAFRYKSTRLVSNKRDLVDLIHRSRGGVVLEDLKKSYDGIEADCAAMIVGGDVIAVKRKSDRLGKTLVLYPRGKPFITQLAGTVTATPGQELVKTNGDFRTEIRRGEAIQVGEHWYRVGSAVGSGAPGEQILRAAAPPSVTLDKDLSERNVYCDPFTNAVLPLDGDFEGEESYIGPCYRHGCSSDIKQCWEQNAEGLRAFLGEGEALHRELVALNLVSKHASSAAPVKAKRAVKEKNTSKRNASKSRVSTKMSTFGNNAHLKGTILDKVFSEARAKAEREEQQQWR